jgi:hypothetical protein
MVAPKVDVEKSTSTKVEVEKSKTEQYFEEKSKFFGSGDSNAKKAFFMLGQYAKRVMESEEKKMAESGTESKFQARLAREISNNMTYRAFTIIMKLLDGASLKCNPILFYKCSGACKELMINSNLVSDKKALSTEDGNMAFSLGLYQQFK